MRPPGFERARLARPQLALIRSCQQRRCVDSHSARCVYPSTAAAAMYRLRQRMSIMITPNLEPGYATSFDALIEGITRQGLICATLLNGKHEAVRRQGRTEATLPNQMHETVRAKLEPQRAAQSHREPHRAVQPTQSGTEPHTATRATQSPKEPPERHRAAQSYTE